MPSPENPKIPSQNEAAFPPPLAKELAPRLLSWYRDNARALPWRESTDPYRVWVSEIMLQQTTVEVVRPYYARFLKAFPTVESLAAAEESAVLKLWEGLGYYTRARNMLRAAQVISEKHSGRFPETYEEIRALPGIGDYTAGAIASICFNLPRAAVDGNVLRVFSRLLAQNYLSAAEKRRLAAQISAIYPQDACGDFTQSLMELGALVCTPSSPKCGLCPVRWLCRAFLEGCVNEYPARKGAAAKREEALTVLILTREEDIALRRRAPQGLLGGLWELPNRAGHLIEPEAVAFTESLGARPAELLKSGRASHVFSHVRWDILWYHIACADTEDAPLEGGALWVSPKARREGHSLPSAFTKLLKQAGIPS
ncbi:MAG TPA: A/G-specific adenine glycosylase [Papillibacter sp.]|nr:A/G-specific adenine glycosylase [Papillibacter sp.]